MPSSGSTENLLIAANPETIAIVQIIPNKTIKTNLFNLVFEIIHLFSLIFKIALLRREYPIT